MHIGITGARGRIGNALVDHFVSSGHQLYAVSRSVHSGYHSFADLQSTIGKGELDVLFHLAWSSVPRSAEAPGGVEAKEDLAVLRSLFDSIGQCHRRGLKTPLLVFFSSCAVYGEAHHGEVFSEDSPKSPVSDYGIAKVEAEDLIQEFAAASGVRTLILRLTNPYGFIKGDFSFQGVIPLLVKAAIGGEAIHIWKNGLATKDFIHLSDVLNAVEALLQHECTGVFNLCSGVATSIGAVIAEVEEVTGKKVDVIYGSKKSWDVQHASYSNVRLREATGWSPRVTFNEGLKRLVEEMTSSPSKRDAVPEISKQAFGG